MKKIAIILSISLTICALFYSCSNEPIGSVLNTGTTLPIVTTIVITNIDATSSTTGGKISSDGGASITARGIVWGISQNPTTADSKTTNGIGIGSFNSSITSLTVNTTYYVRAYATNSVGTAYGNQVSFKTINSSSIPTITTSAISNIKTNLADGAGNISSDGGAPITARGIVWNTTQNPTTADSKTNNGTGTGNFNSSITPLTENTTYYVRAYATNSNGTYYGNQVSFKTTTSASSSIPTLTTSAMSNITPNSSASGGNITSDGGASITARGIVWGTSQNPTTANSKTTNGTGIGSFTSSITLLLANTTYYVRAYATNSIGTYYGNQITFTTSTSSTPSNNSFFAKLDGVQFVQTILYAQKISLSNKISIVANRGGGAEAIGINFPADIAAGAYTFSAFGDYVGQYTLTAGDPGFAADSGTLTISSHDTANKRVVGTFNFTATSFTGSGSHRITEGSFDIKY